MQTGRPSIRTDAIVDEICERLSNGTPLAVICREPGMPSVTTFGDWRRGDPALSDRVAHAREIGEDALAAGCLEIADDGTNDWVEQFGDDEAKTRYRLNGEHVQRSKLRVETRLKLLACWNPKKYGDRKAVELSGPEGAPLASVNLTTTDPVEASRLYQALVAAK